MQEVRRNGLALKELPEDERPREKLRLRGPGALSTAELLAIILNTGTKGESVMALAQRIVAESGGLRGLMRRDLDSLLEVHGLGPAKAIKLQAAIEIGKRVGTLAPEDRPQVRTPEDLARAMKGNLVVGSSSNRGSEFIFTLPRVRREDDRARGRADAAAKAEPQS